MPPPPAGGMALSCAPAKLGMCGSGRLGRSPRFGREKSAHGPVRGGRSLATIGPNDPSSIGAAPIWAEPGAYMLNRRSGVSPQFRAFLDRTAFRLALGAGHCDGHCRLLLGCIGTPEASTGSPLQLRPGPDSLLAIQVTSEGGRRINSLLPLTDPLSEEACETPGGVSYQQAGPTNVGSVCHAETHRCFTNIWIQSPPPSKPILW